MHTDGSLGVRVGGLAGAHPVLAHVCLSGLRVGWGRLGGLTEHSAPLTEPTAIGVRSGCHQGLTWAALPLSLLQPAVGCPAGAPRLGPSILTCPRELALGAPLPAAWWGPSSATV